MQMNDDVTPSLAAVARARLLAILQVRGLSPSYDVYMSPTALTVPLEIIA